MTIKDYLQHNPIAMINLSIGDHNFQYNYWNLLNDQLFLLRDDFSIGHILASNSTIHQKPDGSYEVVSKLFPKSYILNMYFGGNN
jgi:hypothetical protein